MTKRVLVAVVTVPLMFFIFFYLPAEVLTAMVVLFSLIGVYEVLTSMHLVFQFRMLIYAMVFSALVPLWFYVRGSRTTGFFSLFIFIAICFAEALHSKGKYAINQICGIIFFSAFIPSALSSFIRLRADENWMLLILLPVVIAFSSDAGGLFAGMLFGRRKLAPEISPKKTVEGSIGAICLATGASLLLAYLAKTFYFYDVSYLYFCFYGAIGSVVAQFGDLCFSYIKREYHVKDYGNFFPGHGGVLDRFDSVIFCAPICELLVIVLPAFAVAA